MRACVRVSVQVYFNCALTLCFVMGYLLQFGETAHRRVHYYYCYNYKLQSFGDDDDELMLNVLRCHLTY